MADEKGTWKRFQRLGFDSKSLSKRARQAETKTTRHAQKFVISKIQSLRNAKEHILKWLVLVGLVLVAIAVQMVWYQQSYQTTSWSSGGTYAEAVPGPINTLNPLYATSEAELSASRLLFSSLYNYDSTNHLSNDIAKQTTISRNERVYTIELRDDVYWSDDVKLTAEDVVFTVDLMKSQEARSIMLGSWTDITARAIDTYKVQFILPARYAAFSHALTFSILPKHSLASVPQENIRQNTFSVDPVTSGPFSIGLLQVSPDGKHKIANMQANKRYYRGTPLLSRFAIHAYDTPEEIEKAIRTGEVNAALGGDPVQKSKSKTITTKYLPVNSGVYAILNTDSSILSNRTVRRALQVGTDTTELRKIIGGEKIALELPFVSGQLQGNGIPKAPKYDPSQARKLLDSIGWKVDRSTGIRQKAKRPLQLNLVTTSDVDYAKTSNELARQWRELGVEVRIDKRDVNASGADFVQTTLQPRAYDILIYQLVIGADLDVYAYWHSSQKSQLGYNFSNYSSDIADDALTSARAGNVTALRNEKYKDFASQWLQDVPAIGLYQSTERYAYSKGVSPILSNETLPTTTERYNTILYWSAQQTSVYKTP